MKVNYALDCCGVKEIAQLSAYSTPQEALRAFCGVIYPDPEENKALVARVGARATAKKVSLHCYGYLGVQNPMIEAYAVYEDVAQYAKFRFALFSEAHRPGFTEQTGPKYGQNFAALIKESGLGEVIETNRHTNPNSGSLLKVWVWTLDHVALIKWYKKDSAKHPKKQPTASLFAPLGTLSGEPGVNNRWAGNQELNGIGAVPTVQGLGGSLPQNYEFTATCAPVPPRQG